MQARVGTSGFAYKEWKGSFYPEKIAADRMLAFYGERFSTVEINNTFYRMPAPGVFERWAGEVPPAFTFVIKASRRITHEGRLKETDRAVAYLFETAAVLGERLGPVLFQLPPNFKKDVPRLKEFLSTIPPGRRAAMEFRHASWHDDEVHEALRAHGAALCAADVDDGEDASEAAPLVPTAGWGYLRLRRADYDDAALRDWIARIRAQAWSDVFVFFKHEDEGTGPRLAARFLELWGGGQA